ncbi:putative DNA-binding domain-containing protein [uncultured Rhodoferax sp.]|uniref:HvfC/BufC family peptide modification chaperone n=1 Tax=uncultured Rhodoferax sp. TaxID=223188 RepID=UPI0025E02A32|nr:putative DNA-binding domain-containing protein [uncultured Rhodoferax sp.]
MSMLARQQQALLESLFSPQTPIATKFIAACADSMGARGLKAYQSNGHALARRALQAAYPVLARMLGDESFADLARALWHATPPERGDLAHWGYTLPDFVAASAQLADEPYLSDVARAEWALHCCATAADATLQADSLALLGSQDLDTLHLRLAPGTWLLRSPWPVASILLAHRDEGPSLAEAGARLRAGQAEDVLVWRQGFRPCVRIAMPGEADLVAALLAGLALGPALDAAPALDVQAWLAQAVQSGLLLAVHPMSPTVCP